MALTTRPNTWVAVDVTAVTALSYAPRVDPAPWTVSVPGRDPRLGSLEVVITNQTTKPVALASVDFTFDVGPSASALTPTTAGIGYDVSDPTTWQLTGPPPVTSGTATYTLGPASGTSATLGAGQSVVVELYQIQTGKTPGTANVAVKEMVDGLAPAFTTFAVTTFPDGFYFDGLVACVPNGSALVPVAQVPDHASVTLIWNASVADVNAVDVYYSSATSGQQHAKPSTLGEWPSPPLTSDTAFVVVVTASEAGGAPLTAALATGVAVQNPELIATSVNAGQATVTGSAAVDGQLTATGVTVDGNLAARTAAIGGAITATGATISGDLTANGATVTGPLTATGATSLTTLSVQGAVQTGTMLTGAVTAQRATVSSAFDAKQGTVSLFTAYREIAPGTYVANTDLLVVGVAGKSQLSAALTDGVVAAANNGTFTLPVMMGHQYAAIQIPIMQGKYYVFQLGSPPVAQPFERVGDAPSELASELIGGYERAFADAVEALERILERPIPPDRAQALIGALRRL
jgi:cytoskeletal protein CcmA (bactofilin family)